MDPTLLKNKSEGGGSGLKRNRRGLKKNKAKANDKKLTFVGANCAGLNSKLKSFDNLIRDLSPSVIFLQETKIRKQGNIKVEGLKNYQVYQLVRKESQGGGMAIAAKKDLNPVWMWEGNDETEVLAIQISVKEMKIRCVNAYGPQENASVEKKDNFWKRLSYEVLEANHHDAGFVLEMDGNLLGGPELIPNDPNPMNKNGKYLKQFLDDSK
jgi:exonuclease III